VRGEAEGLPRLHRRPAHPRLQMDARSSSPGRLPEFVPDLLNVPNILNVPTMVTALGPGPDFGQREASRLRDRPTRNPTPHDRCMTGRATASPTPVAGSRLISLPEATATTTR
jgi:hypothetical protein